MATYLPVHPSESACGRMILIDSTSSLGTLLHTAVSGSSDFDEIWIYGTNVASNIQETAIEWGGSTCPGDVVFYSIPPKDGLHIIIPRGMRLNNSSSIRAYAASVNVVSLYVGIDRREAS